MENLNAEQIIKALESWAKNFDGKVTDLNILCKAALLIKELTEENERLERENDDLTSEKIVYIQEKVTLKDENERLRTAIPLWAKQCVELEERCMQLRADTVREMQERLKAHLEKPDFPWDSFTVAEEVIDQIAKEMLEGGTK